jgi:hypothetical protein
MPAGRFSWFEKTDLLGIIASKGAVAFVEVGAPRGEAL